MAADSFTSIIPVSDLAAAVAFWTDVLGVQPTFVDGQRWAQFDSGGRRLALAGSDRLADEPGLMVKFVDLAEAQGIAERHNLECGPVERGPHEMRFVARSPEGWPFVFYSPVAAGSKDGDGGAE